LRSAARTVTVKEIAARAAVSGEDGMTELIAHLIRDDAVDGLLTPQAAQATVPRLK